MDLVAVGLKKHIVQVTGQAGSSMAIRRAPRRIQSLNQSNNPYAEVLNSKMTTNAEAHKIERGKRYEMTHAAYDSGLRELDRMLSMQKHRNLQFLITETYRHLTIDTRAYFFIMGKAVCRFFEKISDTFLITDGTVSGASCSLGAMGRHKLDRCGGPSRKKIPSRSGPVANS